MFKFIKDLFTEDDGQSWCLVRVVMFIGACVMIYKLIVLSSGVDFQNFGIGLASMGAAIAGKNLSERK
jgi:hypothetical protein